MRLESFELVLDIGNAEMQTPEDIAAALEEVASKLRRGRSDSAILDVNGNEVGYWAAHSYRPKQFKGGGVLSDLTLNTEFLESIGVDPMSSDDTQFPTDTVYCDAHMRIHSVGWCTVSNALKLPDDDSLPEPYRE